MKPEAQRIAIAEACGWSDVKTEAVGSPAHSWPLCGSKAGVFSRLVPDYLTDLNAMHEAEGRALNGRQYDQWADTLCAIAIRNGETSRDLALARATAQERAEAFLRTLGKWTD